MSAIVAILRRGGQVDAALAHRMLAAAPHRGGATEIVVHGRSVLGVSGRAGAQESGLAIGDELAVALAGKIDNVDALASEFGWPSDPPANPATVAQLILAGFRIFGEDLPGRLRGTFAAVISDGTRLWCFRDHLGFRALFYRDDAHGCYVASEAKQVVAGAGIRREPDREVVERIFYGAYDDETPSALKGVRRLAKATVMRADADGTTLRRYWAPEALLETATISPADLLERFDSLMRQAVERTFSGTVVVSLSGGVDSPAIAAFAAPVHRRLKGEPLAALSAVYPQLPSVDERRYIEEIARFLNLRLHTYEKRANPLDRLQEWVRLLDGPTPKMLITDAEEHYHLARDLGFDTMLTGELAEFSADMRGFLIPHLLLRRRWRALWRRLREQREKEASWTGIAWQLLHAFVPGSLETAYLRARGERDQQTIPTWLSRAKIDEAEAGFRVPARRRWRQLQLSAFVGPGLTIEANEICQALCDVRVRMPWADVDLWEFFLSLPAEVKFPDVRRKGLVRRLLRGKVPDVVLDRHDKTVFDASMMARIDYGALRKWLIHTEVRIDGVDYRTLHEHLRREDLQLVDFVWAKDLAAVHAFLAS